MTYSRSRNQLIVFGGESKSYFSTTVKNDVHAFDIGKFNVVSKAYWPR